MKPRQKRESVKTLLPRSIVALKKYLIFLLLYLSSENALYTYIGAFVRKIHVSRFEIKLMNNERENLDVGLFLNKSCNIINHKAYRSITRANLGNGILQQRWVKF